MIRTKDKKIIYDSIKEVSEDFNRRAKPMIDEAIADYHKKLEQAKQESTKEALILLLPIVCTSLYEAYNFGEVRQQKFIDYFVRHMECINLGVTDIEQYREFCVEQGLKFFDIEGVEE